MVGTILGVLAAAATASAAAAASATSPALLCNETENYSFGGGSIANITGVQSSASCCAECIKHHGCVAYSWTKPLGAPVAPNLCVLKDNVEFFHKNSSITSGLCAPPPPAPPGPCRPPPSKPYPEAASLARCADFPDPFLQPDGTRVSNAAEWNVHKANLIDMIEHYQMGIAPPRPKVRSQLTGTAELDQVCDFQGCVPLTTKVTLRNITLHVGPSGNKTQPFDVFVYIPTQKVHEGGEGGEGGPRPRPRPAPSSAEAAATPSKRPIFVYNGEGYFSGVEYGDLTAQGLAVLLERGFAVANFNRNMLRKDSKTGASGNAPDGVQTLYPENDWGTISVWAWGAACVVDFLLEDATLSQLVDETKIMSIGHSRGGKTALWHAVKDERVSAVFPLMSGQSGNGPVARVGTPWPSHGLFPGICAVRPPWAGPCQETVADINTNFPYWFTERYKSFNSAADAIPWDQHFQRMMVAPRAQLGLEGVTNDHENPVGSQATYLAAQTAYDWLGVPQQLGSFFHPGAHPMNDLPSEHDWKVVADFADLVQAGKQPSNASLFNTTAFPVKQPYSWKAPSTPPY